MRAKLHSIFGCQGYLTERIINGFHNQVHHVGHGGNGRITHVAVATAVVVAFLGLGGGRGGCGLDAAAFAFQYCILGFYCRVVFFLLLGRHGNGTL